MEVITAKWIATPEEVRFLAVSSASPTGSDHHDGAAVGLLLNIPLEF